MKKTLIMTTLLAALGSLPAIAAAQNLSYNYVEGGYLSVSPDDLSVDADGFGLGASALLSSNIFIFSGYSEMETDRLAPSNAVFNLRSVEAGLGYRMGLGDRTDLNLTGAVVSGKIKLKNAGLLGGSESDTGYSLGAGVRHLLTDQIEINGGVNYTDIFDDDGTSLNAGILFHFTPSLAIGGGYTHTSDSSGWQVGLRFNF
jgi:opacity protein-like surface antigen